MAQPKKKNPKMDFSENHSKKQKEQRGGPKKTDTDTLKRYQKLCRGREVSRRTEKIVKFCWEGEGKGTCERKKKYAGSCEG